MKPTLKNFAKLHGVSFDQVNSIGNKSVARYWSAETFDCRREYIAELLLTRKERKKYLEDPFCAVNDVLDRVPVSRLQSGLDRFFSKKHEPLFKHRGFDVPFACALRLVGACDEASRWAENKTFEEAWDKCRNRDWAAWLIDALSSASLWKGGSHTLKEIKATTTPKELRKRLIRSAKQTLSEY